MSRHLNCCRKPARTAKAAVQGMRAPAAVMVGMVAQGQNVGHIPAVDPMEVPDL